MQNTRSAASPWQQQAIDRIEPTLKDLAATVESTIDHLNKRPLLSKATKHDEIEGGTL